MSSLLKIRSERGHMSAIERRIADFILDNAHLLRDYSSQQLANTLKISQSSVVKFCQRLGFKGYPDLKLSISEALVREDVQNTQDASNAAEPVPSDAAGARSLWQRKTESEQETGLLNADHVLLQAAECLRDAGTVCLAAAPGELRQFEPLSLALALLGKRCHMLSDPAQLAATLSNAGKNDVLLVLDRSGCHDRFMQSGQELKSAGGKLLCITRNSGNPLRNAADLALLVSAHDSTAPIEDMLYRASSQHVLDLICLQLLPVVPAESERFRQRYERASAPGSL